MDNIDKDPTVRVLVVVELSAIKQELHKDIVILNLSSFNSFQIIMTTGGITVLLDLPTMCSGILQNVSHCLTMIMHFACSLW